MPPIYLDYNATTPVAPEVAAAIAPHLAGHAANPSSGHPYGRQARRAVEAARAQVAASIGCRPDEVVFTSGGTESNNAALRGVAFAAGQRRRHLIISAVEHPAVAEVCRWLAGQGFAVEVLPVDHQGRVDPAALAAAISPETALVSVMLANNEVGTLQPVSRLAEIAHAHGALFHSDAAQAVGKMAVDVGELGVDLLSIAGHKLYAPKGVGALFVRQGVELAPLLFGAGQEGGRRPGTENLLGLVGLGRACELVASDLAAEAARQRCLRDRLEEALLGRLGAAALRRNGHPEERLPNTLSVSFRGVDAGALLAAVDDEVAASAGAACHGGGGVELSAVLRAMGIDREWGMGTVRLSLGRGTRDEEIERAAAALARAATRLAPAGGGVPSG